MALALQSCVTPEKVMKSNDIDYKVKIATKWYQKKEYVKCIPVFEELMGLMKGTKSTEDIYYMYCWANYKQQDYLLASYHFNNFTKLHPNSTKAEECAYMSAKSYSKLSPKYQLDQTNTYKAIESYQTFVNSYPESSKVDTANLEFIALRKKLEKKALRNADLYFKTQMYKAAVTSYKNLLVDYPDIDDPDYIYYMIVKANDLYAKNSMPGKQSERYHDVSKAFDEFVYRFPKSKYLEEARELADNSHYNAVNAAFNYAKGVKPDERAKEYESVIREIESQLPLIKNEKQQKKIQKDLQRAYYMVIKSNLVYTEDASDSQKEKLLDQSIKTYYTFVDKFKSGPFVKKAEKAYITASDKLKKIKENGQEQKN
jgi:outer membrane protein assembly factor BamD